MASFCFKLQLLGLYKSLVDRHSQLGSTRASLQNRHPKYSLSDCYGHNRGETQWLNQEFKWRAREGQFSAADAGGSISEQHPDQLFSRHRL